MDKKLFYKTKKFWAALVGVAIAVGLDAKYKGPILDLVTAIFGG